MGQAAVIFEQTIKRKDTQNGNVARPYLQTPERFWRFFTSYLPV